MENIIVTGGLGFIGSNFCHYISKKNINVVIIDSNTYAANIKNLEGLGENFVYEGCDIAKDKELIEKIVVERNIDTIIHFAAESHNDNSLSNPEIFIQSNIQGTFNLLELVRKYDLRFHYVSTDEVYGDLKEDDPKFSETSNYNPSSPYSASKAAADLLVKAWIKSYRIRATISNCSNNYGPRQHIEKFIPRQITNLLSNKPIKLYGNGKNIRDWIHVDDHSSAVLTILEKGKIGETYLIGANCEKSNNEVAMELLEVLPGEIEYVVDRPSHDFRYAIDSSKIKRELGWQAKYTDFKQGLVETIKWYDNNRSYWLELKEDVEKKYRQQEKERLAVLENKKS